MPKDQGEPSFRSDAEALYDPRDHGEFLSGVDRDKRTILQETVERYNLIMGHINRKSWSEDQRELASFLLLQFMRGAAHKDLVEVDKALELIDYLIDGKQLEGNAFMKHHEELERLLEESNA